MGIGCVLLFYFLLGALVAAVLSAVLGMAAHRLQLPEVSSRWVIAAVLFPFALLAYAALAFFAYWIWCESARGVDPGIGDTWAVRLSHGYQLVMVDDPTRAAIQSTANDAQLAVVTALAFDGRHIVGQLEGDRFFIIDTISGEQREFVQRESLEAATSRLGIRRVPLEVPEAVYHRLRWTWHDAVAAAILTLLPLPFIIVMIRRFGRHLEASVA